MRLPLKFRIFEPYASSSHIFLKEIRIEITLSYFFGICAISAFLSDLRLLE